MKELSRSRAENARQKLFFLPFLLVLPLFLFGFFSSSAPLGGWRVDGDERVTDTVREYNKLRGMGIEEGVYLDIEDANEFYTLPRGKAEQDLLKRCGDAAAPTLSGLPRPPVESVVMMTMRARNLKEAWKRLLDAYTSPSRNVKGPYHTFLRTHNVSLWEMPKIPYQVFYGERVRTPPTGKDAELKPLRIDLVYTYVNPDTPSFRRAFPMCKTTCERARFTDWNEMLYSSRTAANHVLRSDAFTSGAEPNGTVDAMGRPARQPLLNKVYILVADKDQAPQWMNFSHPMLEIVTQNQTFGTFGGDINDYLPTFNSVAIEMTLHRIPSLNRFYIYINNDAIFGRQLSFFDYFRPLSPERQELYSRHFILSGLQSQIKAPHGFVNLFFEPAYVSEAPRRGYLVQHNNNESSAANSSSSVSMVDSPVFGPLPAACPRNVPLRASHFFSVVPWMMGSLYTQMERYTRERFLKYVGTMAPYLRYAHAPQLLDRLVTEEFIETIGNESEVIIKQRERVAKTIMTTDVMPLFAIAQRRAIARLEVLRQGKWRRWTDEEVKAGMQNTPWAEMHNHASATLRVQDLGPLQENPFSCRLNGDMMNMAENILGKKRVQKFTPWTAGNLFCDVTTVKRGDANYAFLMIKSPKIAQGYTSQLNMIQAPLFFCANDNLGENMGTNENVAIMDKMFLAASKQFNLSEFENSFFSQGG